MRRARHTTLISALTAAAVLIPGVAFFGLGSRQLAREAAALREAAVREASYTARQLATRVAVRLEELRDTESERPYLHYWPQFLSRGETCSGLKLRSSPLARGKLPKTILAHFQIDPQGRLAGPRTDADLGALALEPAPAMAPLERPVLAAVGPAPAPGVGVPHAEEGVQVSPFRWQTGRWRGAPTLFALRRVQLGAGSYTQGFAVNGMCLSHWRMSDGGLPASLMPGHPQGEGDAPVPIAGAEWIVRVDVTPGLHAAELRVADLRRQFHKTFGGGLLGALVAGGCVIALVHRSGRLAEERARFATTAAHELRTPLAGIQLHGEMLAHALGNPVRVRDYAQRITDEAERLGRLVANVLAHTQGEERRLPLGLEPGDLGAAVREALLLVEPIVARAGASLDLEIEPDLPLVAFDRDALHQIVRNLVDNAEKHTRDADDRRIEVQIGQDGSPGGTPRARIAVCDHGAGVPPSRRRALFSPFARPDRESRAAGLGLGLSVVRTLARAHGGDVGYEETPGGGATFVVWLPIARREA